MSNNLTDESLGIPRKSLSDFLNTLEGRYLFHKENAEKHIKLFKPMGFIFGLTIPILAALVTFSMNDNSGFFEPFATAMGLSLTLLTIVNSVLKPDERFVRAAQNCILLNEWKLSFDIQTSEIEIKDEKAFHAMIQDMDNKLSEIGKAMAESYIPKPQA